MSEQDNIRVVEGLFAAIGKGQIPAALELLSPDVDSQSPATRIEIPGIPWAKPRRGRAEVAAFFQELAAAVEPAAMEALVITAQGDRVVVEGRNRGTLRSTGRSYEHDWVMVFTVRDGQIVRHRHYYDTYEIAQLMQGG